MSESQRQPGALASIGLSAISGYVDTVGFVGLFGLFTAHVTGNFVLIGAALANSTGDVLLKLLVFPVFIAAVAASRLIVLAMERRQRPPLATLLLVQLGLLCGFLIFGWLGEPISSSVSWMAMAAGASGAAAMGMQNGTAKLALAALAPTTVMTGNVTQLVIDVVDLMRGAGGEATRERSKALALSIAGFGVGAITGALGYYFVGFRALLLPVAILAMLSWHAHLSQNARTPLRSAG